MERYRHNLGLELTKSYLLKSTRIIYSDLRENGLLLLKSKYDKKLKKYVVLANVINSNFETTETEISISLPPLPSKSGEPNYLVKSSFDHQHYLVLRYGESANGSNYNQYSVIDKSLNLVRSGEFKIPGSLNYEQVEDAIFDDNQNFSVLFQLQNKVNALQSFAIFENDIFKILSDSLYQLEKPVIFFNPITKVKGISGFYTNDFENGYLGEFSAYWKNLATDSFTIRKTQFTYALIKGSNGDSKLTSSHLAQTYLPLKIICRSDGGYVKISENSFILREKDVNLNNSGSNAVPGKNVYNFENVIIQNYDSLGQLAWENWISKNQNTINDGGLLGSVFISSNGEDIHLLYNDPIATGGDIILYRVLPSGQLVRSVAAKGDDMNSFIIPGEGKQIARDKILVPVIKDRKFALLKISFR